jgi:hypothetical protein
MVTIVPFPGCIFRSALLLLASAVTTAGCGGRAAVGVNATGIATLDGAPLPRGDVIATGQGGVVRQASIDDRGGFTLLDVPPGPYALAVRADGYSDADYDVGEMGRKTLKKGVTPINLPDRYRDPSTSGLTANIAEGVPLRIDLSSN